MSLPLFASRPMSVDCDEIFSFLEGGVSSSSSNEEPKKGQCSHYYMLIFIDHVFTCTRNMYSIHTVYHRASFFPWVKIFILKIYIGVYFAIATI